MNLLQILSNAAGVPVEKIVTWLENAAAALPDAAPEINTLIERIRSPLTAELLGNLSMAVIAELKDIASGHIVPKDHPSDFA